MISVIMPVYNVERYLATSIESVLNQTFEKFELILVDDGSPDGSPSTCDAYAAKDNRVRVIHKKNGGLSSARNAGIECARGKYIYTVDSDDTIATHTLKVAWETAERTDADLVIVGVAVHQINQGKETSLTELVRPSIMMKGAEIGQNIGMLIKEGMYKYAWDKLYKKECILSNNVRYDSYYDRVCEDTVFLYDLLPYLQCVATVPRVCYHYNVRDDQSVVKKYIPERFEKYLGRLKKLAALKTLFPTNAELEGIVKTNYYDSVLWSIANMFHKDCKLNWNGVRKFYANMLVMDDTDADFRKAAFSMVRTDTSGTDRLLILLYQLHLPSVMAVLTLLKRRNSISYEESTVTCT